MACSSCAEKTAKRKARLAAQRERASRNKSNTTTVSDNKAYLDAIKRVRKK